jgi:outer membrane protein OmpA-like peptidoglycan-associated protein
MKYKILTVGLIALSLSACTTTNPYTGQTQLTNTTGGALLGAGGGAVGGALIGAAVGGDPRVGALIGAGVGALAGGAIGNYMDEQEAELRAQLQGTGVTITRVGDKIYLNMPSNVTFNVGQANVRPQFQQTLASVALIMQKYNKTVVDVYGHTDSTGSEVSNLELSKNRAIAVANVISANGVDPRRFYIDGKGENQPVATNTTAAGRAMNRRVEIQIAPLS